MAKKQKNPVRFNAETGLKQTSVWLLDKDVQTLREMGKRPDIDREWSWLARKAIREFIEQDRAAQTKLAAFEQDFDRANDASKPGKQ